uniref:Necrosis-inducing secreted protein 1 n=1 Tax=Pyricularia oryzae TaxID=318829 RepID=UPI0035B6ABFF
ADPHHHHHHYINSMSAPASVQRGQAFTAQLNSSIYVQNYDDFGVVWGLAPPNLNTSACVGCVGRRIGYTNLFGDKADVQVPPSGTVGVQVTVPADQAPGEYLLIAGASYLVGASGVTGFNYFNTTVQVCE